MLALYRRVSKEATHSYACKNVMLSPGPCNVYCQSQTQIIVDKGPIHYKKSLHRLYVGK